MQAQMQLLGKLSIWNFEHWM